MGKGIIFFLIFSFILEEIFQWTNRKTSFFNFFRKITEKFQGNVRIGFKIIFILLALLVSFPIAYLFNYNYIISSFIGAFVFRFADIVFQKKKMG